MFKYKCIKDFKIGYEPIKKYFYKGEYYFMKRQKDCKLYYPSGDFIGYISSGELKSNFISMEEDRDQKLEDILN